MSNLGEDDENDIFEKRDELKLMDELLAHQLQNNLVPHEHYDTCLLY